ncbi:MAG: TonB-dependent receptor [Ignavibacteriaceae bacterium]|jgi:iron complex outermembrane receptor protein|nr:TonB-dependent receptor [Chlorobium sp.]MCW8824569.1 TonB-dependent receptor [Ignavibacteriaceae bacterium]MCW8962090.1 TonB-dependent receptor [Ignavibacteriaceae bacterium]
MKNIFTITCALILLLSIQFFPQEEEKEKADTLEYGLEEVTIVGTRTKEKIIDIPYSVFSVEKKELMFGKKVSAKSVLADVPGLFLQSRYGTSDLRVSIRGFGNRSNTGIRGVRILQDGIPESEPDGESVLDAIDFTSLGGVEVVKGNLSSLYANAPGGVIDFKTDIYFPDEYVSSTNQFGQYGFRQNGFKLGLKNDENRFFLSYYYRNLNGYRNHSDEYQHLLNSVYEGYLGTRSSITVLGNYVNGFNRIPGSLTKEEYESDPFMASPIAEAFNFRRITRKGRLAVKYRTGFGAMDANELEITGYGGIKELEKVDNEFYTLSTRYSLGALIRYANRSVIVGRQNTFTAGMDYAYQSGPVNAFENIGGNRGLSVENEFDSNVSNIGFYFLDHYNILEQKLDLFFSSRYDLSVFSNDIFIPYGSVDSSRTFNAFTPKIGLNFKITPEIALYTSYGLSYDFPALTELENNPLSSNPRYTLNPDIDPSKSDNFELGIKGNLFNSGSDFMKKVIFDITGFYYKITDEIVPFIINQKTYFRNAAKTNRKGVEIGIKTEPFEETEMVVNYTYTDFKYDEFLTTNYTPSGQVQEDYSGNYEPSVPKQIINFIFNYDFEITDDISGLLQWDCDYIAKLYVDDANSATAPDYFYGNIMLGAAYNTDLIGLVFYVGVNNIFDKRYVGFVNINDYYERYYETGEPRTFYSGLNFNLKF